MIFRKFVLISVFCLLRLYLYSQVPFLPPDSLKASQQCDYIYLSWQAPGQNIEEITGYNVFLEDSLLTFTADTLFQIQKQGNGFVTFNVTTVYNEGESIPASVDVELIIFSPATNLHYNGDQCQFTWSSPLGNLPINIVYEEENFQWCDDFNYEPIGTGGTVEFDVAAIWPPENLIQYNEGDLYLTAVDFYPTEASASYTIMVWEGYTSQEPDNLIYSQEVTNFITNQWNKVTLDDSILIAIQNYLWVGYHINTDYGYPAGVDNGPAIDGLGNMMNFGGWQTLLDINPDLDYNWNIKATLTYAFETMDIFYNIYGFWSCDEPWGEWAKLNEDPISDTSFYYWCAMPMDDWRPNDCFVQIIYCGTPVNSDTTEFNICWWSSADQLKNDFTRFLVTNSDGYWLIHSEDKTLRLIIYDLTGKIIYKSQDEFNEKMINNQDIAPGIYILEGITEKERITRKIFK
jgi:hypothetical protein